MRVVYVKQQVCEQAITSSILVSVPKKKFKHATDRNRIKRMIREAYRLNKQELIDSLQGQEYKLLIAFLYIGKEISGYTEIEQAMQKALSLLKEKSS